MTSLAGRRRLACLVLAIVPFTLVGCSVAASPTPGSSANGGAFPADTAIVAPATAESAAPIPLATADIAASFGPTLSSGAGAAAEPTASASLSAPATGGAVSAVSTPTNRIVVGPVPSIHPIAQPVSPRGGVPTITPIRRGAVPCSVLPSSNVWNKPVAGLSVASNSAAMINAIGLNRYLHPDFDAVGDGIPYNVVNTSTPTYTVSFDYADESDPGPYPIPASPKIEAGSDGHLLAVDMSRCMLWELYDVRRSGSGWAAGSGAVFDLRSNALRPDGWTSADAAGLPIYPGLVRYDEVMSGSINHAIRFTASSTCGYIYPATHLTAQPCSNLPPMGLRVRLKASVDISGFGAHAQVVLKALKTYGMILADNGSPWYISGAPDSRWNDDEFHALQNLTGSSFEVVDTSALRNG
jgi:hypothetical protein